MRVESQIRFIPKVVCFARRKLHVILQCPIIWVHGVYVVHHFQVLIFYMGTYRFIFKIKSLNFIGYSTITLKLFVQIHLVYTKRSRRHNRMFNKWEKGTHFVTEWKSKQISHIQIFFPVPNVRNFHQFFFKYNIPFLMWKMGGSNSIQFPFKSRYSNQNTNGRCVIKYDVLVHGRRFVQFIWWFCHERWSSVCPCGHKLKREL